MTRTTPIDTLHTLLNARGRKDVDAAVARYQADATVVIEPGKVLSGTAAVPGFTEAAMNLPLEFGARQVMERADTALHLCRWKMQVPDGTGGAKEVSRCTTDVLKKQPDGTWLLSIDNGGGTAIVDGDDAP